MSVETSGESNRLTETLEERLSHPATSPDFDLKKGVNTVLADVGMTSDDCGGELSFYGSDPILQSPLRFGTMAAIGLAGRSVAVAALWRQATGEGQNILVDVRKALRRFCGFFDGKWETVNGRPPSPGGYAVSPFLKMGDAFFRETRDGRYVVALDIYPQLLVRTLDFLRCSPSTESINNAIRNWDALELEQATAAEGLVLAMIRTNEEFLREPQYTQVLSKMPLVTVEKIGGAIPFRSRRAAIFLSLAFAHSGWVMSLRGARWEETWRSTARTCSTSGDPAIRRSKPSGGTSRWECVQQYWTIRRRIAHGSISFSGMLTYSLPISAQDFWKSTTSMPIHFANRSPD